MDTLYGILIFAAFMGMAYLWGKAKDWFGQSVNKHVLSRSEYKEGKELVSAPLEFHVSAPISDILISLRRQVVAKKQTDVNWLTASLYEIRCDEGGVVYAFGNKVKPQVFVAVIVFGQSGSETKCTFTIANWTEADGVVIAQDEMKELRKRIQSALTSVGTAGGVERGEYCQACGIQNLQSAKFCKECGTHL
jgi:hypothetical protein